MNKDTNFILNGRLTSINARNLTFNDAFLSRYKKEYKYLDHPLTRRKIYDAYLKMQQGYPNSDIPTNEIRAFCQLIVTSFFRNSLSQMTELFDNPNTDVLDNISLRAGEYLSRGTGIENTSVVFDLRKEASPIRVYIDALRDIYKDEIVEDPLEYKMENGFFKFLKPENVHITVIISISYLRNLMNTYYDTIIRNEDGVAQYESEIETHYLFDENHYLRVNDIIRRIWKDFLASFTIAIYKDSFREKIYSYIYFLLQILAKETKAFSNSFLSNGTRASLMNTVKVYGQDIKRIIENIETTKDARSELNAAHINNIYKQHYQVQAFDLYLALFEPLVDEVKTLRSRLNFFDAIAGIATAEHPDSRLDDLNRDFDNESCNLTATSILLSRILPLMIMNEIWSKSNKYRDLSQFIDKISQSLQLSSFAVLIGNNYHIESITHLFKKVTQMRDFVKQGSKIFINGDKLNKFVSILCSYRTEYRKELQFEEEIMKLLESGTEEPERDDLERTVL